MSLKRIAVFVGLIIITFSCYFLMNRNYDELARYPYDNEAIHDVLLEKLNEKEISYIVNYGIAPEVFMDYINLYDFNIYHCAEYDYLKTHTYQLNNQEIINIVELLINKRMDIEEFAQTNQYNSYSAMLYNIQFGAE